MRICILSIVNIKHMSLISLYTSYLDKNKIDYDIIYIDKYNEEEFTTAKGVYRFPIKIKREWNSLRKLSVYWKFKKYAENIISENKYDYIIVWRTETAFMFSNFLARTMKGKYSVNIRDYCLEKNPFVYFRTKRAIKSSDIATISSSGFKSFLPKRDYIIVHSFNKKLLEGSTPKQKMNNPDQPLHFCFIGYVRFFEIDKKIINALGNDPRYIIQYFGEGSQHLEEYCREKNYTNVEFVRGFKLEETTKLLEKADVINNLYGHNEIALDTAVSTKYYYALYMNIPIVVFKNTYMEQISSESGIGFAISDDEFTSFADDFYKWYMTIDFEEFKRNCLNEILRVETENVIFESLLKEKFKRSDFKENLE